MDVFLPDIHASRNFGFRLGNALASLAVPVPVFFYGGMGMGKTTIICALVKTLPGGEKAETSSPSFTLCNLYDTMPPVAHFDLYRQENGTVDESLLDFLDEERHVVLVEWAERLPAFALPPSRIECAISAASNASGLHDAHGRTVRLKPCGDMAKKIVAISGA